MKKTFNRSLGLLLSLVILSASLFTPASAADFTMDESQWDSYWSSYCEDGSSVYLAPGSDESQMNIAWMGAENCDLPEVHIKAQNETEYSVFTGVSVDTGAGEYSYHVTVTGLESDTTYDYFCVANGVKTDDGTFKTSSGGDFSALYVTDIHLTYNENDESELKNIACHVNDVFASAIDKNDDISLIFSGGDQATQGRLDEYKAAFSSSLVKSVPFALSCGNHDYKDVIYPTVVNNPNTFNQKAISPDKNGGDYWFVKGDVLFLMLNTNWISAEDHRTFLELAVKANPDVKWRVAVMHHDLYGGHIEHREEENKLLRLMFPPLFDEFDVDVVFMGHSHIYSRSHVIYNNEVSKYLYNETSVTDPEGTVYITSGSASRNRGDIGVGSDKVCVDCTDSEANFYSIVDFKEDSITYNVYIYGNDSEPYDSFTINKTTAQGGHSDETHIEYDFVYFISLIASIGRNIGYLFEKLFSMIGIEL